ncbi:alpha/beta fold hydrolase [Sphingomonas sp. DT-207]|uniref:alpha/beta fold hydrolase n=1 Tax=Sphingomonas sp. DT-207 TaxID=3396167 RepID=UPI003F1D703F
MATLTTRDGTRLFYKDWGSRDAQPIVFHHGWPLSSDDWDNQMLFFLGNGYRVVAHDRRGHGRSDQTDAGHEMDTYAADVAELAEALDLENAVHIGHSTGGGEVSEGLIRNWWRQGMMGGAKAPYDCIVAFSETDFTEDLQAVSLPVLVMHGEDDQVVPIEASARTAIKLLPNGTLKTYPGLSHGIFATHPDIINADLLAFIKGETVA